MLLPPSLAILNTFIKLFRQCVVIRAFLQQIKANSKIQFLKTLINFCGQNQNTFVKGSLQMSQLSPFITFECFPNTPCSHRWDSNAFLPKHVGPRVESHCHVDWTARCCITNKHYYIISCAGTHIPGLPLAITNVSRPIRCQKDDICWQDWEGAFYSEGSAIWLG